MVGERKKNGGKAIGKKTNLKMRKRWKWSYQKRGKEFRKSERKQKQRHLGKRKQSKCDARVPATDGIGDI